MMGDFRSIGVVDRTSGLGLSLFIPDVERVEAGFVLSFWFVAR